MNDSATPGAQRSDLAPLLYRWDDLAVSFSPSATQLDPHYHGAAELVVTFDHPMQCMLASAEQVRAHSLLIPPGVLHQNNYIDPVNVTLYFDADSSYFTFLTEYMAAERDVFVSAPREKELQECLRWIFREQPGLEVGYARLTSLLAGTSSVNRKVLDARIVQVVRELRQCATEGYPVSYFAGRVGLSEDRLHHLFTENIGVPLHRYRLWLRLKHASKLYFEGFDLTYVAQESGFSDAAHFSRTFKRMFGESPQATLSLRKSAIYHSS